MSRNDHSSLDSVTFGSRRLNRPFENAPAASKCSAARRRVARLRLAGGDEGKLLCVIADRMHEPARGDLGMGLRAELDIPSHPRCIGDYNFRLRTVRLFFDELEWTLGARSAVPAPQNRSREPTDPTSSRRRGGGSAVPDVPTVCALALTTVSQTISGAAAGIQRLLWC